MGIGASAGGLQAIETFFALLPADCNMAFVIVRQLPHHHESLMEKYFDFRIFGTDNNADVLGAARRGEFLENIEANISGERLKRFFTKRGNSYYVNSRIREAMVFADHDVTRAPLLSIWN